MTMMQLDAVRFASNCIIWTAAYEGAEHWGGKRQVATGWPVDQSLLNEKSQQWLQLAVAHLEALAQIVDRRGLAASGSHGSEHLLLAG
jgi:hypothetical protein